MNQSDRPDAACILVVDDTIENIQILGGILRGKGYEINIAQDGLQALEAVAAIPPDLILLDIMMPGLDGFETCKRLKADPNTREIPIIFLTARTETEDIVRGFQLGAVDYIVKPFNAEELLVRVNTHLSLKFGRETIQRQHAEQRELVHILCHDLTNPISFISGLLQIAEDRPEILNQKKSLMVRAADNCLNIIELVRRMRALDEGKLSISLTAVNLQHALSMSIDQLQSRFEAKGVQPLLKVEPDLTVLADETSFVNSVLNNIFTNAIKFSFSGSVIVVEASRQPGSVTLTITDSGIGIPERLREKLFDLGEATSREGTAGESGTGFGMPLMKKFITLYGGTIEVFSREKIGDEPDHGTQVKLVLKTG